jgi:DNA-binding GntR family transcriptional regulator
MADSLTDEEILAWERDQRRAVRIAGALAREIRKRYAEGQLLPSNRELAERMEASAETVGEAKALLVERGIIKRDGNHHFVVWVKPEGAPHP